MFWEREEGDVDVLQSVVVVGGRPDSLGVAAAVRGFQECSLPFSCEGCSSGAIRGAAARTGLVCRFSLVIEKNTGSVTPEPSFALHPTASIKCQRARERVPLALCPMYAVAVCLLCLANRGRTPPWLRQRFHFPSLVSCPCFLQSLSLPLTHSD